MSSRSATASRSRCSASTIAARSSSACARSTRRPARTWDRGASRRRNRLATRPEKRPAPPSRRRADQPAVAAAGHRPSRRRGLGANIEIKAERGRAAATAAAVARCIAGRRQPILVSSFAVEALATMRDRLPETATGLLLGLVPRNWRALATRLGCATVNLAERRVRPHLVGEIAAAGYRALAYTVNDPARAATLFGWGVTSVFSDAPDIILGKVAPVRQGGAG